MDSLVLMSSMLLPCSIIPSSLKNKSLELAMDHCITISSTGEPRSSMGESMRRRMSTRKEVAALVLLCCNLFFMTIYTQILSVEHLDWAESGSVSVG